MQPSNRCQLSVEFGEWVWNCHAPNMFVHMLPLCDGTWKESLRKKPASQTLVFCTASSSSAGVAATSMGLLGASTSALPCNMAALVMSAGSMLALNGFQVNADGSELCCFAEGYFCRSRFSNSNNKGCDPTSNALGCCSRCLCLLPGCLGSCHVGCLSLLCHQLLICRVCRGLCSIWPHFKLQMTVRSLVRILHICMNCDGCASLPLLKLNAEIVNGWDM